LLGSHEIDDALDLIGSQRIAKGRHPSPSIGDRESQELIVLFGGVGTGADCRPNRTAEINAVAARAHLFVNLGPGGVYGGPAYAADESNGEED
jgi:hypothetical protein